MIKRATLGSDEVKVTFAVPSAVGKVSVVGDFNGWSPMATPMRARSNGTRSAAVVLPAGRTYRFRYLAEGDRILAGRVGEVLREVPLDPADGGPWEIEASFIAAVRAGRRSATPSFWDGLKYMELTEAIGRSAEEGRTIELPFDPDPPRPPAE